MLRTDRQSSTPFLPIWSLILLSFLIFVLSIHFAFDDIALSSIAKTTVTTFPNQSELTHQDDIVHYTELTSYIPTKTAIRVEPVRLPIQIIVISPHFNPPNI